jgi:hypothetical protein
MRWRAAAIAAVVVPTVAIAQDPTYGRDTSRAQGRDTARAETPRTERDRSRERDHAERRAPAGQE